ncbi:MAG: GAF domain-containing protein [Chloroflexi bacterium]|nr:GAF domain-containing protein [Chloroflexota bacterium]
MVAQDAAAGRRPHPGEGLVRRFTLVSLAVTLLATALTMAATGWIVERYLLDRAAQETSDRLAQTMRGAQPRVFPGDPLPAGAPQRLAEASERVLVAPTERVAFWSLGGQQLYASAPAELALSPALIAQAAAGRVTHEIVAVDRPAGPHRQLRLLVPLRDGGGVAGDVEREQDFGPLAAPIAELQLFAALSLVGFAAPLYLLLLRLVRGAARRLRQQAEENASLLVATQRASAVAHALVGTAQDLARLAPLDQVLGDVAARAVDLLKADDALIFLVAPDRSRLVLRAHHGVPAEKLARFPYRELTHEEFPAFARVCAERQPLAIAHAPDSPLLPPGLAAWYGVSSCLLVPLAVGEQLEGVMVVHFSSTRHVFAPEEIALATGLAAQAAIALANVRAFAVVGEVEALRELSRLKSEFVSVASHELRTPLAVVLGYAELLATRVYDGARVREIAAQLESEAQRLSRLVDELLDLGRLESGRFGLDRRPTDLLTLAQETVTRYAESMASHQLVVAGGDLPLVAVDRERMRQVLDNLIANAIRYSPRGGTIRVKVAGDATAARLSVTDEGLGLTPEDAGRLFERFYRSSRAEVRAIKGTGLGLAIAQAIVEAHGGRISATSPGPGHGSTFTVELPLDLPAAPLPQRASVDGASAAPVPATAGGGTANGAGSVDGPWPAAGSRLGVA